MTEQDVFNIAREVCGKWPSFMTNRNLQAFAKLIAEHEREACAKVCEDREEQWRKAGFWGNHHEFREMAFAIRARGQS